MAQPDISTVLTGVFGITTVIIGARLQHVHQQNLKLHEALNDRKQTFYFKLMDFMEDVIDGKFQGDVVDQMKRVVRDLIYYAPTSVVKSFGDYMQHVYAAESFTDEQKANNGYDLRSLKLYAELKVQIRRDLGNASRRESWFDILRLTIKDIKSFIPKYSISDRGRKTNPPMKVNGKDIK